jgi:hypothetical protein
MPTKSLPALVAFIAVALAVACGGTESPTGPSQSQQPQTPQPPSTQTFSNASPITIPSGAPGTTRGPANPYPSTINVTGMAGNITKAVVSISGFAHAFPDDVGLLLVGPLGQDVLLMFNTGCGFGIANVTLTFDQSAAEPLPDETLIAAGTYRPTRFGVVAVDLFDAPAPAPPYSLTLEVFNGTNPNGAWRLFVYDDGTGDVGMIAGGWSMTITSGSSTTGSASSGTALEAPLGGTVTAVSRCGAAVHDRDKK